MHGIYLLGDSPSGHFNGKLFSFFLVSFCQPITVFGTMAPCFRLWLWLMVAHMNLCLVSSVMFFPNFSLTDKCVQFFSFFVDNSSWVNARCSLLTTEIMCCVVSKAVAMNVFFCLSSLLILGETGGITSWQIMFFLNTPDMLTSVKMTGLGCWLQTGKTPVLCNAIRYSRLDTNPAPMKLAMFNICWYFEGGRQHIRFELNIHNSIYCRAAVFGCIIFYRCCSYCVHPL